MILNYKTLKHLKLQHIKKINSRILSYKKLKHLKIQPNKFKKINH